jgi:hypothetical protein
VARARRVIAAHREGDDAEDTELGLALAGGEGSVFAEDGSAPI